MQLPSYLHRVRGALRRTESRCRSNSCRRFRQPSRSAKTRSPTSAVYRAPDQIIQPVKPAYSSCVTTSRDGVLRKSSRPISGFRSLCGREQHSSSYCAQFDLRFGTFHSVGSRFENSGLYPLIPYGASDPGPMLCRERSRSGTIFQVVFLRSNRTLSGRFVACDGPRNTRQIGFWRGCGR
jgi:hypothetical protein